MFPQEKERRKVSIHHECVHDTLNTHERPRPIERQKEVEIIEEKSIKIGKNLSEAVKHEILATVAEFCDIFAFSTEEMPGIPPSIMCHKLDIKPGYKSVKQKLRHQGKERIKVAKEEVEKLLKPQFIRECKYSDWLSNVVLVKKPNGKWRMYVNFTNLNKACSKDD